MDGYTLFACDLMLQLEYWAQGRTDNPINMENAGSALSAPSELMKQATMMLEFASLIRETRPGEYSLTERGIRLAGDPKRLAGILDGTLEASVDLASATQEEAPAFPSNARPGGTFSQQATPGSPVLADVLRYPRPEVPTLLFTDEPGGNKETRLGAACTLGRSEGNDIVVPDQRSSRRHATLRYHNGTYVLEDHDSANGTIVNGEYVKIRELAHNDRILIGRSAYLYLCPEQIPEPSDLVESDLEASFVQDEPTMIRQAPDGLMDWTKLSVEGD